MLGAIFRCLVTVCGSLRAYRTVVQRHRTDGHGPGDFEIPLRGSFEDGVGKRLRGRNIDAVGTREGRKDGLGNRARLSYNGI